MLADDIIVCIESREQVDESLGRLRYAEKEWKSAKAKQNVCVNESETAVTVEMQGADIVKVDDFKYLRSTIQSNRQRT